jgi:hypothetical protein
MSKHLILVNDLGPIPRGLHVEHNTLVGSGKESRRQVAVVVAISECVMPQMNLGIELTPVSHVRHRQERLRVRRSLSDEIAASSRSRSTGDGATVNRR